MKIRQATASDADEIARIINAAFEIEREFRRGERTSPSEVLTSMSKPISSAIGGGGRVRSAIARRNAAPANDREALPTRAGSCQVTVRLRSMWLSGGETQQLPIP